VYISLFPINHIIQTLNTLTQLQHAILDRRKKLKRSQAMVAVKLSISQNRYSELETSVANIDAARLLPSRFS
jgi:DNA-directed RNA polymerase specialized sigma subunit